MAKKIRMAVPSDLQQEVWAEYNAIEEGWDPRDSVEGRREPPRGVPVARRFPIDFVRLFQLVLIAVGLCAILTLTPGCGDQPRCYRDCHIDSPVIEPERVCWTEDVRDLEGRPWLQTCCVHTEPGAEPPECFLS